MIQRRDDYGGENRENFNRDWDDYKSGFGDPDHEFWLGNENIYMLTNAEDYSLRVELEDFEGNKRYQLVGSTDFLISSQFFEGPEKKQMKCQPKERTAPIASTKTNF